MPATTTDAADGVKGGSIGVGADAQEGVKPTLQLGHVPPVRILVRVLIQKCRCVNVCCSVLGCVCTGAFIFGEHCDLTFHHL